MALTLVSSERTLLDRVVAVVNDEVITASDVNSAAQGQPGDGLDTQAIKTQVLDQLIQESLISQEVEKAAIVVTEPKVDAAIQDILRQNGMTEEQLMQALSTRGMSEGAYRSEVKDQLERLEVINMKVRAKVSIPDAAVREAYEAQIRKEGKQTLVSIRHLFFAWTAEANDAVKGQKLALAQAARKRVTGGEPFHLVAMEVSEGPTAKDGGSLGEIQEDALMPELSSTVKELTVEEISQPIVTSTGVHVVKLDSRRASAGEDFETAKAKIHQQLYQKAMQRQMKLWVDELRAQGTVIVKK